MSIFYRIYEDLVNQRSKQTKLNKSIRRSLFKLTGKAEWLLKINIINFVYWLLASLNLDFFKDNFTSFKCILLE